MIGEFPKVEGFKDFPGNIAAGLLDGIKKYKSSDHPYWIQIMGIPGSGKTTLVQMIKKALNDSHLYTLAAFDEYMEQIPDYHLERNRVQAFTKYEAPARAAGFKIFEELIERKVNVLFEHSTVFPAVKDLMYFIKQSGYTFILIRVTTDTGIAKNRVKKREKRTKRHVPESLIDERAIVTAERWDELSKISDAQFSIENNGKQKVGETFKVVVAEVADFVKSLNIL
ncbi:MAG: zeta toxin family protein [Candidatus Pacebacteria bacterium]|nr:zeta toxin family protein [Candidatus Paceibacterota bacterium]